MRLDRAAATAIELFRTGHGRTLLTSRIMRSCDGGVTVTFAMMLGVLFVMIGGMIDFGRFVSQKSVLQSAADTASLAAAKELSLTDTSRENAHSVVESIVDNYLKENLPASVTVETETSITDQPGSPFQVHVTVKESVQSQFGRIFGLGVSELTVNSTATVVGKPNICLLALEPSANSAIDLNHKAKVIGQNCSIFSNSIHSIGIKSKSDAVLQANTICSAGGVQGGGKNFTPAPITDCPQFDDPLAGRPEPSAGPCIATNLVIHDQTMTLNPGTYCGGLSIDGTSKVTFNDGVYIIKDGPLAVEGTAEIDAAASGFYFSGQKATFSFDTETVINLSAPKSGPLAGLLFFGSRAQSSSAYKINSDHARQLLGTIYLPGGVITIDANKPIADLSAYTAIVARKVVAYSGPTVTLNTNYSDTDVPVPDGIRGAGERAVLAR